MIISAVIVVTYNIILYKTPYKNNNNEISSISELICISCFEALNSKPYWFRPYFYYSFINYVFFDFLNLVKQWLKLFVDKHNHEIIY